MSKYETHDYLPYLSGWENEETEEQFINRMAKRGLKLVAVNGNHPSRTSLFFEKVEKTDEVNQILKRIPEMIEVAPYYLRLGHEMVDTLIQFGIVDTTKCTWEVISAVGKYIGYVMQCKADSVLGDYVLETVRRLKYEDN